MAGGHFASQKQRKKGGEENIANVGIAFNIYGLLSRRRGTELRLKAVWQTRSVRGISRL